MFVLHQHYDDLQIQVQYSFSSYKVISYIMQLRRMWSPESCTQSGTHKTTGLLQTRDKHIITDTQAGRNCRILKQRLSTDAKEGCDSSSSSLRFRTTRGTPNLEARSFRRLEWILISGISWAEVATCTDHSHTTAVI